MLEENNYTSLESQTSANHMQTYTIRGSNTKQQTELLRYVTILKTGGRGWVGREGGITGLERE